MSLLFWHNLISLLNVFSIWVNSSFILIIFLPVNIARSFKPIILPQSLVFNVIWLKTNFWRTFPIQLLSIVSYFMSLLINIVIIIMNGVIVTLRSLLKSLIFLISVNVLWVSLIVIIISVLLIFLLHFIFIVRVEIRTSIVASVWVVSIAIVISLILRIALIFILRVSVFFKIMIIYRRRGFRMLLVHISFLCYWGWMEFISLLDNTLIRYLLALLLIPFIALILFV